MHRNLCLYLANSQNSTHYIDVVICLQFFNAK